MAYSEISGTARQTRAVVPGAPRTCGAGSRLSSPASLAQPPSAIQFPTVTMPGPHPTGVLPKQRSAAVPAWPAVASERRRLLRPAAASSNTPNRSSFPPGFALYIVQRPEHRSRGNIAPASWSAERQFRFWDARWNARRRGQTSWLDFGCWPTNPASARPIFKVDCQWLPSIISSW